MTDKLREAATNLLPYLDWQMQEGGGHHPTLPSAVGALRAALAAAPQPALADRAGLVEMIREAMIGWRACKDRQELLPEEAIADALLARGLHLPGGDETIAWAILGEDGKIVHSLIWPTRELAESVRWGAHEVHPVAIRVVERGDE